MLLEYAQALHNYPGDAWEHSSFDGWERLCNRLGRYIAPTTDAWANEKDRKWELVSVFQKAKNGIRMKYVLDDPT